MGLARGNEGPWLHPGSPGANIYLVDPDQTISKWCAIGLYYQSINLSISSGILSFDILPIQCALNQCESAAAIVAGQVSGRLYTMHV